MKFQSVQSSIEQQLERQDASSVMGRPIGSDGVAVSPQHSILVRSRGKLVALQVPRADHGEIMAGTSSETIIDEDYAFSGV